MRPLVQRLDAYERVHPDQWNPIYISKAVDSGSGSSEPVAALEADLEDAVEALRLLHIAWMQDE